MGKVRGKGKATVAVYMRLEPEVAARLDELAESTAGSRGDVVKALVSQARLEPVTVYGVAIKLQRITSEGKGEAVTDD